MNLEEENYLLQASKFIDREKLRHEIKSIRLDDQSKWTKRAKIRNLKEWEYNTTYLHQTTNGMRRRNNVRKLEIDVQDKLNQEDISKEFQEYFSNLFKEEYNWRPPLDSSDNPKISSEEKIWLERPI